MLYVLSVGNFENTKHIRVQEKHSSPSYRQRSPNGTRSISRHSEVNQIEIKSSSTNTKQNHGKSGKIEASSKSVLSDTPHKNDPNLDKGNDTNRDKGTNIDIRVQQCDEITKTFPVKKETKPKRNKKALQGNLYCRPNSEHSMAKEKGDQKLSSSKNTISKTNTSKTKSSSLEVEWTHLQTPPSNRKTVVKSPSQTAHPIKNTSSQLSLQNHSLEKNSSSRKIAQKARTTNLALSMKIAQSANISHSEAKHERETEELKRLKVTKQRGREH